MHLIDHWLSWPLLTTSLFLSTEMRGRIRQLTSFSSAFSNWLLSNIPQPGKILRSECGDRFRGNTEWNYFWINPVLDLLGVGEIVQLGVLLPLVGPVQPQAHLQGQHQGHEAGSHQHRSCRVRGWELMWGRNTRRLQISESLSKKVSRDLRKDKQWFIKSRRFICRVRYIIVYTKCCGDTKWFIWRYKLFTGICPAIWSRTSF